MIPEASTSSLTKGSYTVVMHSRFPQPVLRNGERGRKLVVSRGSLDATALALCEAELMVDA